MQSWKLTLIVIAPIIFLASCWYSQVTALNSKISALQTESSQRAKNWSDLVDVLRSMEVDKAMTSDGIESDLPKWSEVENEPRYGVLNLPDQGKVVTTWTRQLLELYHSRYQTSEAKAQENSDYTDRARDSAGMFAREAEAFKQNNIALQVQVSELKSSLKDAQTQLSKDYFTILDEKTKNSYLTSCLNTLRDGLKSASEHLANAQAIQQQMDSIPKPSDDSSFWNYMASRQPRNYTVSTPYGSIDTTVTPNN